MTRPNILFLMSDEHRADVAGYAGDDVVRTPTLDWLASTGVVFRNAYTPSPICIPARQCIASGQLPRTCGVERFGQDLPPFSMTFAQRFAQHRYHTACCGKLHHLGRDQMQGWRRRVGYNQFVSDGFVDGLVDADAIDDSPTWGDGKWSDAKEIQRAGIGTLGEDAHTLHGALHLIQRRYADPYFDRPGGSQPTLLKVSFNRPHYPYITPQDKFEYYLHRVQPFVEHDTFGHPFLDTRRVIPGEDVTEWELRRATAAYYGMIEENDDDYATILDALRHVGQDLDDWIIVYTSDHGEMLGEHGVWEKQKFFEGSARVPLIIRWPKRFAPRTVAENVNLCDLFATLCDLADVPPPAAEQTVHGRGLDSRSLVPLMTGDTADWYERYSNETVSQFGATNLLIKRDTLKYQWYERPNCREQPEVLFDLDADPHERTNLIDEPRYAARLADFRKRRDELGFGPDADLGYRNAGYDVVSMPDAG